MCEVGPACTQHSSHSLLADDGESDGYDSVSEAAESIYR